MMRAVIEETWTYGYCESCLKNTHEKVEMVKERLMSCSGISEEMWVCTKCGATKRL